MPEITSNHHQNTQFTNHTYQITQNSGNAHHTMIFRTTNTSHDHQGFYNRVSFQSDGSLYGNFPFVYCNNHIHNPNIAINHPEAAAVEQVRFVGNKASLLLSVMVSKNHHPSCNIFGRNIKWQ